MVDVVIDGPGSDTDAPLTVQKRVRLVARWLPLSGASILDGGCGAGGYVQALLDAGAIARGVEFETDKVAKWNLKNPGNDAVQHGDMQNLNFPDASFDAVLVNEVLEHVPDQNAALAEAFRVLRPGGLLFLFAPNRFHPFETHGYLKGPEGQNTGAFRTMGMPYLPESWRPRDLRAWARNYWPSELRRLVEAHGFSRHHTDLCVADFGKQLWWTIARAQGALSLSSAHHGDSREDTAGENTGRVATDRREKACLTGAFTRR